MEKLKAIPEYKIVACCANCKFVHEDYGPEFSCKKFVRNHPIYPQHRNWTSTEGYGWCPKHKFDKYVPEPEFTYPLKMLTELEIDD
jgi:hypothetical protein